MRLAASDFSLFWQTASQPVPIVIVGAGRWGRVWASVLTEAREDGRKLSIVARSNYLKTREWALQTEPLRQMTVVDSISAAWNTADTPKAAVIASRPRDHVGDALEALSFEAHLLVEKPLGDDPAAAQSLLRAASAGERRLAIGTEFAFLPAFHHLANMMAVSATTPLLLTLTWTDPVQEVRYGEIKSRHTETSVLEDLLPHAFSIFRIFRPGVKMQLAQSQMDADAEGGSLQLLAENGDVCLLSSSLSSDRRRRLLQVEAGASTGAVDFTDNPPTISFGGKSLSLPAELRPYRSTLRLELGAFLAEVTGRVTSTPSSSGIHELVALQQELRAASAR